MEISVSTSFKSIGLVLKIESWVLNKSLSQDIVLNFCTVGFSSEHIFPLKEDLL